MNGERSGPSHTWIARAVIGFSAAVGGFVVGLIANVGVPQGIAAPTHPEPQGVQGITREDLERAKREILEQMAVIDGARSRSSASAAPTDDALALISRRMDELEKSVAQLGSNPQLTSRDSTWIALRGQGYDSIDTIVRLIREGDEGERHGAPLGEWKRALTKAHWFWTFNDLVTAYGPPRAMDHHEGWNLYYGGFRLESVDGPCVVQFRIEEGFVADVDYDFGNEWR